MPLLYYWKQDNYYRDLDYGAGYHLNHANPLLHSIEIGDSLWAFTRNKNGYYVLAAELVIKAKTFNPPNFRYGKYRVWGDLTKSKYFNVDNEPSIEQVIRSFDISAKASILGRSFQGFSSVRKINIAEHQILFYFSKKLPLEPRARILPEEKLEAELLLGNTDIVEQLVKKEPSGISLKRKEYLYKTAPKRNTNLVKELQGIYKGKCQICEWTPIYIYGVNLCEGHHFQWISRGGEDKLDNMVLICPNHHSAIHKCDAPLDYKDLAFDFGGFREKLQLNKHL